MNKKTEQRPKPISIRPKTQAERDHYMSKGGAKWFHAFMAAEMAVLEKKAGSETSTARG